MGIGRGVDGHRGLLAGKRVMILKASEDWTLSMEELLRIGREGHIPTGGGERGLSYLSWLKVLLFMSDIVGQEYRMMDMMQMYLRRQQDSFRMRRGVYQAGIRAAIKWKTCILFAGICG